MRSHQFFRESGVVSTRRRRTGWVWPAAAVVAVLALNAWGVHADGLQTEQLVVAEAERAASFEAGRTQGRAEVLAALQTGRAGVCGARP